MDGQQARRRAGHRREEILQAALRVFAERGYRGASLAAVAERVGLTQQGVLHYFPSKERLLVEVLRLRDQLDRVRFAGGELGDAPPSRRLAELVSYNATRPGIVQSFTVLAAESVTEQHPARPFFTQRYASLRRELAASLDGELAGRLPPGLSSPAAAALLIAVMDGLQTQWLLAPEEVDMPALFGSFLALLRAGDPGRTAGQAAEKPPSTNSS
ncbi:MAG: TetR/AcrR family transcriptional regulator [Micromonosporaceae bacterium]|nr:TetR/AcrR family transcriptional regulator [Micromonosporaceae bacterium]